jgi:hypothetical protein
LLDPAPLGFDSIAAFKADGTAMAEGVFNSPYAGVHRGEAGSTWTVFAPDASSSGIFWLLYMVDEVVSKGPDGTPRRESSTLAVARYRLVLEDGDPVVRLGLLCEADAEGCAQLQSFLLKGLPIAPPPRR